MGQSSMYASDLQSAVTDSFHLINTVRVATEHLTRDVQKVIDAGADDKVLEALYAMPTFATGQNLRAFATRTSEQHARELASLWLFTVIGHYEVWADELPVPNSGDGCQFPTLGSSAYSTQRPGFGDVFAPLAESPLMTAAFGSSLTTDVRSLGPRIDDALALYRLYKECRNSLAHSGGKASDRVERWSSEAASRASDLHVDGYGIRVQLPSFTRGQAVELGIEQVRCLVSLLFRIAQTVDGSILLSTYGESDFIERWQRVHGIQPIQVQHQKLKRPLWLTSRCQEAGVPTPNNPMDVTQLLLDARLVRALR